MRILTLTYPITSNIGGYTSFLYNLSNKLSEKGIYFEFIFERIFPLKRKYKLINYSEINLPPLPLIYRLKLLPFRLKKIHDFDIIFAMEPWIISGLKLKDIYKKHLFGYFFNVYDIEIYYTLIKHKYEQPNSLINYLFRNKILEQEVKACNLATKVAVSSYSTLLKLVYSGVDIKKIEVLPPGIDTQIFRHINFALKIICDIYNIDENEKIILYVGGFGYRKGLDLLIISFAKLLNKITDSKLRLLIVGNGPQRKYYGSLVKKLKIADKVIFTGEIENKKLPLYYSSAYVLVYPSFYEGLGFVPIESMACETPVIASKTYGLIDVIKDGYNGLLFRSGDIEDLTSKMYYLIKNEELRDLYGKHGREFVLKNYNLDTQIKKFETFFKTNYER
jgi:glycosyltransferase involved in cell wall biosynthesis